MRDFAHDLSPASSTRLTAAQSAWLAAHGHPDRPTLIFDLAVLRDSYRRLSAGLEGVAIHYAVKANPAPEVLETLHGLGSRFDAASLGEVEACLAAGAAPAGIAFGNTVKRPQDIARAWALGVRQFAADAPEELDKIAAHAPGAEIVLRLLIEHSEADWPLTRKFGAPAAALPDLARHALALGLTPTGISFHVGSQTREPAMWTAALDAASAAWHAVSAVAPLRLVNIGGGFPAVYGQPVPAAEAYGRAVLDLVRPRFPGAAIMAEPGRGLVAQAGVIAANVLLVAQKAPGEPRWVYLDIGKFSGLAETIDEAIRYEIETPHGGPAGPCILAGPSCDSADVLYEKRPMAMPLALAAGDPILILATGAYTTSYASVGFNGFPPLSVVHV